MKGEKPYLINDFFSFLPHTWVEAKDFLPAIRQTPAAHIINLKPCDLQDIHSKDSPKLNHSDKDSCYRDLMKPVVMHCVHHWLPISCGLKSERLTLNKGCFQITYLLVVLMSWLIKMMSSLKSYFTWLSQSDPRSSYAAPAEDFEAK